MTVVIKNSAVKKLKVKKKKNEIIKKNAQVLLLSFQQYFCRVDSSYCAISVKKM